MGYLKELSAHIEQKKYGKIATITGRYYAMDRDKRWERVQLAYEGLTLGVGEASSDPFAVIILSVCQQSFADNRKAL